MNREDIIREADEWLRMNGKSCRPPHYDLMVLFSQHIAALVAKHTLANIDPSSFMSWQEGYAAGAAERDKSFRAGFYAGFMASGEGWNGEYPFQDNDRPVIGDPLVEAALTAALASRGDA